MLIEIVDHIDLARACEYLRDPAAGGLDLFVGTVRNQAGGKEVLKLEFEAYGPMALSEMRKIGSRAAARWPLSKIVMLHVLGKRKVGEAVVLVGASSAHRAAAFEACRFLIDELKTTVPIWKKEFYSDSSVWVAAHP
jgi:molybdopterin synthase catalytic subunit